MASSSQVSVMAINYGLKDRIVVKRSSILLRNDLMLVNRMRGRLLGEEDVYGTGALRTSLDC